MERRLSAILAADVVGYSRLMGANEVGTLQSLQNHQAELIEPRISGCGGRIVKLTGDGMLVEFPSVVNAVEAACAIQRSMPERNADVPEDRRIEFRIGINLGDVIVEGDDIFGDGVNVAARIEGVARPGGIAVSQSVHEHIGNKLDLNFYDRGEEALKNIERPVRVYDIILDPPPAATGGPVGALNEDKPSIAVLPFNNMSGDPEQEYFSDGIAEDIITDLSKISALFVVGRNTSFSYKGMSFQLPKVAAELGVKFLLEGSVRKAGERVRVTAQLIDGVSGGHLWADRYDRDLTDIFAIQDEITKAIVEQLKIRLVPAEQKAINQAPTDNVEAYTYYLKGRRFFHNSTKWFLGLARQMFAKAIELDPMYARAYSGIANCDSRLTGWYAVSIPFDGILAMAEKALALDPLLADAHAARGYVFDISGRPAEAEAAFERALELDPNSFEAHYFYGRFWIKQDNSERAAEELIRALEVNPEDAQAALHVYMVLHALGRHEEGEKYARLGLKRAEEALRQHPESSRPAQLAGAALARLGEAEEARRWMDRALAIDPDDTHVLYNAACMWTQLGETDRALELLEKWSGFVGVETSIWIKHDSDLDALRDHPAFKKIVERIDAGIAGAPAA
jgi:adenylate cyclase